MAETRKKNQANALPIGTILKGGQYPYRIEKVLGQGGYGITYKVSARVKSGNIPVTVFFAIKENFVAKYCSRKSDGVTMTYPENCEEEAQRDLNDFVAEGRRLEQLCKGHKNIVNVNETFYANNTAYYAMEYINGGDLCKMVKQNGRISEHKALNLIVPIIDAVGYVHEQQVMHYDIKPENIMIRKGENGEPDEPVLIDFGIALHYDANGNLTKTSKDRGVGCSDGYAPIEQYAGDFKFSPESDIYALAATLLYLLSGKNPQKAFDITPGWIEKNLPIDVNSQTRSAIIHSMKKLKEDRTQTAGEFMNELGLSGSSQKQTTDSDKTHKYKKEPQKAKVNPVYEEPVIKEEQAEQGNLFDGLGFWERIKKARELRSWKSSALLYIGVVISFCLSLLCGFAFESFAFESVIICLILPFFIFHMIIALLCAKKWGFWGLLVAFFAYFICIGRSIGANWSIHDFGILFIVVSFLYMVALFFSFYTDGSWSKMDNKINDKHSVGILLSYIVVFFFLLLFTSIHPDASEGKDKEHYIEYIPNPNYSTDGEETEDGLIGVEDEAPIVEPPKQPTDEEVYNKASKSNDWETMLALAKKGYTPACGILARHYVDLAATRDSYCRAYYWAKKASKSDRDYVMNILKKWGFLVNGEPVTTCDNINYNKI